MCIHDENQLLKSRFKFRYQKFLARPPQTMLQAPQKNARAQLHTYIDLSHQRSPNLKFLTMVVMKFLLNLAFKK